MEVFIFIVVNEDYNLYIFDMCVLDIFVMVYMDYVFVVFDVDYFFIGKEFVFVSFDKFI